MDTGKITITVAIITVIGTLGTGLFANWDKVTSTSELPTSDSYSGDGENMNVTLKNKIIELESIRKKLEDEKEKNEKEIEELKYPFHQINNSKLKQLLAFHNDASCYGQSLNFTHEPDKSYNHCVTKKILAKRFLKFFEELEIIESDEELDYSRARAKDELINLQIQYQFTNPGWYTEFMLGILIIEYAKKS